MEYWLQNHPTMQIAESASRSSLCSIGTGPRGSSSHAFSVAVTASNSYHLPQNVECQQTALASAPQHGFRPSQSYRRQRILHLSQSRACHQSEPDSSVTRQPHRAGEADQHTYPWAPSISISLSFRHGYLHGRESHNILPEISSGY